MLHSNSNDITCLCRENRHGLVFILALSSFVLDLRNFFLLLLGGGWFLLHHPLSSTPLTNHFSSGVPLKFQEHEIGCSSQVVEEEFPFSLSPLR